MNGHLTSFVHYFDHSQICFQILHVLTFETCFISDTLSKLSTLGSDHPSCADRSKKICEGLIECVYFFSDLFPDYFKIFEPVLNYVENLGGKPPDQNRINGMGTFLNDVTLKSLFSNRHIQLVVEVQYRNEVQYESLPGRSH